MRPRHKAAENPLGEDVDGLLAVDASMRPRHKAAENPRTPRHGAAPPSCFNEAAA